MVRYGMLSCFVFIPLAAMVVYPPEDLNTAIRNLRAAQNYLPEIANINYQDPETGNEGAPPRALLAERYGDALRTDLRTKAGQDLAPSWYSSYVPSPYGMYSATTNVLSSSAGATFEVLSYSGVSLPRTATASRDAASCVVGRYRQMSQLRSEIMTPDRHSAHTARVTTTLPQGEQMVLKSRAAKVHSALIDFLGESIEEQFVPSIGLACSGGGIRALLETAGWLSGAQTSGLYNCLTYMSGLSGSTWALNTYLASGMSMADYKEHLKQRLAVSMMDHIRTLTSADLRDLIKALGRIYYNGQNMSVVDIYGILLAQILLKGLVPNPYEVPLSALMPYLKSHPFPLSTAVLGFEATPAGFKHHPSYEFSPVSAGSFELQSHVPIWALGRVFKEGVSQTITPNDLNHPEIYCAGAVMATSASALPTHFVTPAILAAAAGAAWLSPARPSGPYYGRELPLSFYLGVCGSAFSTNMYNAVRELYMNLAPSSCPRDPESAAGQTEQLSALALGLMKHAGFELPEDPHLEEAHYGAASVPNPTFQLAHAPLAVKPDLPLVDAGFEMLDGDRLNIGIVPLLYRRSDVIIICDSSQDLEGAPSLRAAARLAQALNIHFPSIPATVSSMHVQLFAEDDLDTPFVLYMPGIANPGFDPEFDPQTAPWTDTTNFTYTPEQSAQLMDLISHTVQDNQTLEVIKRTFRLAIERKKERAARHATILGRLHSWWQGSK